MAEALEFEGQEITEFFVAIPSVKLEADESYARGTYLDLQVQVRVRSSRFEETRSGDLQKVHVMAVENVAIAGVTTPEQHRAAVEAAEKAAEKAAAKEESGSQTEPVKPTVAAVPDEEEEGWDEGYPQGQPEPAAASAGF